MEKQFHEKLKQLIHQYILLTYESTKAYPSSELFGMTSQDRRAAVSVMLNYVEGYARRKPLVMLNFFETSYASLKESIYVRFLAKELDYIKIDDYRTAYQLKDQIGAMLYQTIRGIEQTTKK